MNAILGEPPRLFDPSIDQSRNRIPRSDLIVYNPDRDIYHLQSQDIYSSTLDQDETAMVVHIDGACRNNGRPNARAAYGVYFGPSSVYNSCGTVPSHIPQTSTRAEIEALAAALNLVGNICGIDYVRHVIIATDSSFLVKSMSQWIEGWIKNGGRKADGARVAHFERLKELHEKVKQLE